MSSHRALVVLVNAIVLLAGFEIVYAAGAAQKQPLGSTAAARQAQAKTASTATVAAGSAGVSVEDRELLKYLPLLERWELLESYALLELLPALEGDGEEDEHD